ncbi:hypothetical protein FOZ63_027180 [Perkinsus olseni]|uniref:Uncharacterized protein n=1 Tax=Perkinsus olseni TaxID=32597 RepID=A0A7J6TA60_PEROL|nr:hypothetical protein FOZ63_027180 [Perkinsus olseni]
MKPVFAVKVILLLIGVTVAVQDGESEANPVREFNLGFMQADIVRNPYQLENSPGESVVFGLEEQPSPEPITRSLADNGQLCRACQSCFGSVVGIGAWYCWVVFGQCGGFFSCDCCPPLV